MKRYELRRKIGYSIADAIIIKALKEVFYGDK